MLNYKIIKTWKTTDTQSIFSTTFQGRSVGVCFSFHFFDGLTQNLAFYIDALKIRTTKDQ